MSQSLTYTCDVCGAVKKEANHWWRALVKGARFLIVPWEQSTDMPKKELHLCGLECAHKAMAKHMSEPLQEKP